MPEKRTFQKAEEDLSEGKSATTAAGEYVHEEIEHVREGKHGARSTKQAIAIGLSKARRAGVPLPPPKKGRTSERTRRAAERQYEIGQGKKPARAPSRKRSRAVRHALEQEPESTVSKQALAKHAKDVARERKRAATAKHH
jgi:hypothetical protein